MASSQHPGMGAIPYADGVTFRVWAPFASKVSVTGTFNNWQPEAIQLAQDGNSAYWSCDVLAANVGDQYKFVLRNASIPDRFWKNDPYARAVTNSVGNSIIAETGRPRGDLGYATPNWNEMVIYELHVGSFRFDPGSGNGRGNFDTVIGQLDYLVDLGINVIQLMPSDEFPQDVSMGYNPAYIFAIESSYGGPNGLRKLVDAAHAKGIAIIYDVVYNHFGPDDLDMWQFDGWNENGQGGIYFYNNYRKGTPWGNTRPDYGRGEVRQFIRDNALRWLEERGCDGLRFDATGWIRNLNGSNDDPGSDIPDGWSLLQWVNNEVQARQPWKLIIAEDMQDNDYITRPTGYGGAGFSAQWGAKFMHTVRYCLATSDDGGRDMEALRYVLGQRFNDSGFQRVIYTESHDEVAYSNGGKRVPELISPGNADSVYAQKRSTLGGALVMTAPGIPMIFMGQEFLEWGSWTDGASLDWSKAAQFAGIRSLYRDLIHLRRNWFNTTRGLAGHDVNVHHVNNPDKVIAFHRWANGGPGDDVVVIVNMANRTYYSYRIGLPRGGRWHVRFNSDSRAYSPAFTDFASYDFDASPFDAADNMPFGGKVGLGPYTCLILSQDGA